MLLTYSVPYISTSSSTSTDPLMSNPSFTIILVEAVEEISSTVMVSLRSMVTTFVDEVDVVMESPPDSCSVSVARFKFIVAESSPTTLSDPAATCESTYALTALADAKVSSDADTDERSVSNTPVLRSATSMLEIELPVPSTSKVLLVNVSVSDAMLASSASTYALIDC